ncbi:YceI family protein [Oligoflexia bacterium]|nr:YceI family protein [Oligoflexia bacterium]
MRHIFLLIVAIFILVNPAAAAEYDIDASHSKVIFKIKHLAISTVTGEFKTFKGSFFFDPKDIVASNAQAELTTASIFSNDKKRDDHLRNPDFFNVPKYPNITFKTTKIIAIDESHFKAHGNLLIKDVSKPVVLDVEVGGLAKDPWGNERAAFVATTEINRRDFGLTWSKVLETGGLVVGDKVRIILEIEGIKRKK